MRSGSLKIRNEQTDLLADLLFAQAFAWLQENPDPLPRSEPYPISGEDVFARVIEYIPAGFEEGRMETHHAFVDLQVCLGPDPERILVADAAELTITEDYPDERDVTFYATPTNKLSLVLSPGEFAIFDTETDAHMPQRIVNYKAPLGEHMKGANRKVVIKLKKSALTPGLKL